MRAPSGGRNGAQEVADEIRDLAPGIEIDLRSRPVADRFDPVESVRDVVEGAVGAWARNEYFEMNVDGLTPSL